MSVTATVSGAKLAAKVRVACGWVKQGVAHTLSWKAPARGSYTITWTCVDRGGNRQYAAVTTALTVR